MQKKESIYFPHYANARHDRKIKRLIKDLGIEGYGMFFMVLEILREQTDLCYPLADLDLLSDEFRCSEAKLKTVVLKYDLFEVNEDESFFSPKQVFYLQPMFEKRKSNALNGIKGNLIKKGVLSKKEAFELDEKSLLELNEKHKTRAPLSLAEASKVKESKVKESKVKESKVKESKVKESITNPLIPLEGEFALFFDNKDFVFSWQEFLKVKKRKKGSTQHDALRKQLSKIKKWSKGNIQYAIDVLEKSYNSGWSDVYELKDSNNPKYKNRYETSLEPSDSNEIPEEWN